MVGGVAGGGGWCRARAKISTQSNPLFILVAVIQNSTEALFTADPKDHGANKSLCALQFLCDLFFLWTLKSERFSLLFFLSYLLIFYSYLTREERARRGGTGWGGGWGSASIFVLFVKFRFISYRYFVFFAMGLQLFNFTLFLSQFLCLVRSLLLCTMVGVGRGGVVGEED